MSPAKATISEPAAKASGASNPPSRLPGSAPLLELQQALGNQELGRLLRNHQIQTKLALNQPGGVYEQEADRAKSQPESSSTRAGLPLQRKCTCGSLTSSLTDECADCKSKNQIQAKLTIGASTDPLEQEADRVADEILASSANPTVSGAALRIQRFTGHSTGENGTALASVDGVLSSPGSPLGPELRQDMEQRFGYDFSRVRVHSGGEAEQSALEVNANAYTVGHNVVFGAGRFAPETPEGRRLIAHELTHVVQQSGSDGLRVSQGGEKPGLPFIARYPMQGLLARQARTDEDKYCRLTKSVAESPRTKVGAAIELVRRAGLHALHKPPENEPAMKLLKDVQSYLMQIVTDENLGKHFPGASSMSGRMLSNEGLDAVDQLIGSILSGNSMSCGLWDYQFARLQVSRQHLLILSDEADAKTSQLPKEINEAFESSLVTAGTITLTLVSGGVIGAVTRSASAIITSEAVLQMVAGTRATTLIISNLAAAEEIFLFAAETVLDIVAAGGILEFLKQDPTNTIRRVIHIRLTIGDGTRGGATRTVDVPADGEIVAPGKIRIRLQQAPSSQAASPPGKEEPKSVSTAGEAPKLPTKTTAVPAARPSTVGGPPSPELAPAAALPPRKTAPPVEPPKTEPVPKHEASTGRTYLPSEGAPEAPTPVTSSPRQMTEGENPPVTPLSRQLREPIGYGKKAEGPIIRRYYPDATTLPEDFPAYDGIRGGKRSFQLQVESIPKIKGKVIIVEEIIEGGEAISIKTFTKTTPQPQDVARAANDALKDIANMGENPSRRHPDPLPDGSYWRVTITKKPDKVILHLQLTEAPTPEMKAAAEKVAAETDYGAGWANIEVRLKGPAE